jgi:hypothetical protein
MSNEKELGVASIEATRRPINVGSEQRVTQRQFVEGGGARLAETRQMLIERGEQNATAVVSGRRPSKITKAETP